VLDGLDRRRGWSWRLARLAMLHVSPLERERAHCCLRSSDEGEEPDLELSPHALRTTFAPASPRVPCAGRLLSRRPTGAEVQRLGKRFAPPRLEYRNVIEAMLTFSRSGAVPAGTCGLRSMVQDVLDDLATEPRR
jgi:hypothetical protein